jgi:hypothetical protein
MLLGFSDKVRNVPHPALPPCATLMLYAVYVWYNPLQNASKNLLPKVNSAHSKRSFEYAYPYRNANWIESSYCSSNRAIV